jgi:hypothetical protein
VTNEERRRFIREVLDRHNDLADAMRQQGEALDAAITAFRAANEANIRAIDAMIAANRAALAVYNDEGA